MGPSPVPVSTIRSLPVTTRTHLPGGAVRKVSGSLWKVCLVPASKWRAPKARKWTIFTPSLQTELPDTYPVSLLYRVPTRVRVEGRRGPKEGVCRVSVR